MQRMLSGTELLAQFGEGLGITIVAINVLQSGDQFREAYRIQAAIVFNAVFCPLLKLLQLPSGFGHSDYRDFQLSVYGEFLQSRKNLLLRQVAGGSEEYQRIT